MNYESLVIKAQKEKDFVFFEKDGNSIYDICLETNFTNIAHRLAFFLWVMRGSNKLKHLSYYNECVILQSDDGETLRGAYGPRLKFWVGVDQLQEAINKNLDIDDPEDMVKPKGVDQMESMFEDLKNGLPVTCCTLFDPALDFEESKNIPNLVNMVFNVSDKKLNLLSVFNYAQLDGDFSAEYFFVSLLHFCFSKISQMEIGKTRFLVFNPEIVSSKATSLIKSWNGVTDVLPTEDTPEKLFKNLFKLFDFEKHMRSLLNGESVAYKEIDFVSHISKIREKTLEQIDCQFWKDYGLVLLCFSLMKYGKGQFDFLIDKIEQEICGSFKEDWIRCREWRTNE